MLAGNKLKDGRRKKMGVWIKREQCIGCGECVQICPGDLLYLDQEEKVSIRSSRECWQCMACVKCCLFEALSTKLPYSSADYGGTLCPYQGQKKINWVSKNKGGRVEKYFPTKQF